MRWLLILWCCAALAGEQDIAGRIREAMAKSDYATAADLYAAWIASGQTSPEVRSNYGVTLHLLGHNQQALEQCRLALSQQPDLVAANLFAGISLVDLTLTNHNLHRNRTLGLAGKLFHRRSLARRANRG